VGTPRALERQRVSAQAQGRGDRARGTDRRGRRRLDSLGRERVHRARFSRAEARQIVLDGRGSEFDPDVVDALHALPALGANDPGVRAGWRGVGSTDGVALSVLTPREREVLQLAADGLSSTAIAEALVVSPGTVKTHFPNSYAKLGAGNRASAVAIGLRRGLLA
jgi:DNA-binding NarL/FixJ family response regulator